MCRPCRLSDPPIGPARESNWHDDTDPVRSSLVLVLGWAWLWVLV